MEPNIKDHALENIAEEKARELEDTLWWTQGRKHIIRKFLRAAGKRAAIRRILDIGCGSGGNFDVLCEFGSVVGVDRSATLVRRARARGTAEKVYREDVFQLTGIDDFDVFTLFDVLEHIENDSGFLGKLSGVSKDHIVLISVPACPALYSEHDRILHHYRRYSGTMLKKVLRQNGYEIIKMSHFMFFLFPLALLARLKEKCASLLGRRQTDVSLGEAPPWLNRILTGILHGEALLSKFVTFPTGLWLFVLARRRLPPAALPGAKLLEKV